MAAADLDYLRDPDAIYRASFAAIRSETDLDRVPDTLRPMALRLVHACGMTDILDDLAHTPDAVAAGRTALAAGAPVLADSRMVAAGIRAARLPAGNPVITVLRHPDAQAHARRLGITRSAAGIDLWRERIPGAVVAIGNAPTALFRLLELLDEGCGPPALVLAFPVGFVGAADAKEALVARGGLPYVTLRGRRGGSAFAAAAVNALILPTP